MCYVLLEIYLNDFNKTNLKRNHDNKVYEKKDVALRSNKIYCLTFNSQLF